jgi:hypothetical protein
MSYYDSDARRTLKGMGFPPSIGARIDAGLRAHMQRVFGYMAGGLALTRSRSLCGGGLRLLSGHRGDAVDLACHASPAWLCAGP